MMPDKLDTLEIVRGVSRRWHGRGEGLTNKEFAALLEARMIAGRGEPVTPYALAAGMKTTLGRARKYHGALKAAGLLPGEQWEVAS